VLKANELCPSPNLQALDIGTELGDSVNVTIKGFDKCEVGKEKQVRSRLFVEEFDRPLVINRTNVKALIDLYGNDTSDWIGEQFNLYVSETSFQGDTVRCLRVRAVRAEKGAEKPAEEKPPATKSARKTK
jgi:hypothetical protein